MTPPEPSPEARPGRRASAAAEPIAITGYGLTTCLGIGAEANWRALRAGRSELKPISRFDVRGYHVQEGGEAPPLPAAALAAFPGDLAVLAHLAGVCREALTRAGLPCPLGDRRAGLTGGGDSTTRAGSSGDPRAGLVVGSSLAASDASERFFRSLLDQGLEQADYRALEAYYIEDHLARLSEELGLRGPALLVSNACAAGGSSAARAVELIRAGRCDRVLASGYDALSPFTHAGFGSLLALSRGRARPFGEGRDGMKLGDGYAALLLETVESARAAGRPVQALLAGYGESADAHHLTHPHPEGLGAALAMRRALAMAGLAPEDIDYINCHGTATPSNDQAEGRALRAVFGERLSMIPVNASKPNFGHTLGGAGTVEAVVALLVLLNQALPPSLNVDRPDPDLPGLDLVPEGRPARVRRAMSNSFGFGGCNASLVLALPDEGPERPSPRGTVR